MNPLNDIGPGEYAVVSHPLCPYVQRVLISLAEKGAKYRRVDIDMANKPDWFLAISPQGKTPVLVVGQDAVFDSAAILEYLEDTLPAPLHPADPLERARHCAWMDFASVFQSSVFGWYNAQDEALFDKGMAAIKANAARLEAALDEQGPYFAGERFSVVDAAFAPSFRLWQGFDRIADFHLLDGLPRLNRWRARLAERASVSSAVAEDYPVRLLRAIKSADGWLAKKYLAQADVQAIL